MTIELPEHILAKAWEAFSASVEEHDIPTALADALTATAPLIISDAYCAASATAACPEDRRRLSDLASKMFGL